VCMVGNLVDMWCAWRTKKNNGIFEPETRLYLQAIPFLIASAGCLVFGYGVQKALSWVALFFGFGMISVALTAVSSFCILAAL
jgi:hypothetical protein